MPSALEKAEIGSFLETVARHQLHGSGHCLARKLSLPIAFLLPEQTFVFNDHDNLARRFDSLQTCLQISGVSKVEPRNLRILDASKRRAFVSLDWHYLDTNGETLRSSQVQYVLKREDDGSDLQIEMADYATLAYPQYMQPPAIVGRA